MRVRAFAPIKKVAAWIRSGYPPDAPPHGHVALIALCGKRGPRRL
jgi:hypothetical protein